MENTNSIDGRSPSLMEVGRCHYRFDDIGGRMPIFDTTPAEVAVLRETFKGVAQGDPITMLFKTGTIRRSGQAEIARLRAKYADNMVMQGKNEVAICDVLLWTVRKGADDFCRVGRTGGGSVVYDWDREEHAVVWGH